MNNLEGFEKFNELNFTNIFGDKVITIKEVEKSGVDDETKKHNDYTPTLRYALSNLNDQKAYANGNRTDLVKSIATWINKVTKQYPHINHGTMKKEFDEKFPKGEG